MEEVVAEVESVMTEQHTYNYAALAWATRLRRAEEASSQVEVEAAAAAAAAAAVPRALSWEAVVAGGRAARMQVQEG